MIQRLLVLKRKAGDREIVTLAMVIKQLSSAADVLTIKQLNVGNRSSLYSIVSLLDICYTMTGQQFYGLRASLLRIVMRKPRNRRKNL